MAQSRSGVQNFLLHCVAPIACSVIVGYTFFGAEVFNRYNPGFQFLWSAVVATVYYYLLMFVRQRDASLGLLLLFALTLITTGSTRAAFILRDILYFAALAASIYLYAKTFRGGEHLSAAYPAVALAGLYSLMYVILSELHLGILRLTELETTIGSYESLALTSAFYGALIGGSVGVGIAIGEKVFGPPPRSQAR